MLKTTLVAVLLVAALVAGCDEGPARPIIVKRWHASDPLLGDAVAQITVNNTGPGGVVETTISPTDGHQTWESVEYFGPGETRVVTLVLPGRVESKPLVAHVRGRARPNAVDLSQWRDSEERLK